MGWRARMLRQLLPSLQQHKQEEQQQQAGGDRSSSRQESCPAGPWGSLGQSPTARLTSDVLTSSTYHQTTSCSACPVECTVHGSDNERSVSLKQDGVVYIFLYVQLLLFFFFFSRLPFFGGLSTFYVSLMGHSDAICLVYTVV